MGLGRGERVAVTLAVMARSGERRALVQAMRRCRAAFSRRFAVAWAFLAASGVAAIVYTALSLRAQAALVAWSSTNVDNLRAHPIGSLAASAFIPGSIGWIGLIALALFGACRLLGNARAVVLVCAGHVIGTLVSEGIVADRVAGGRLPASARLMVDVGPSYLVVSALGAMMLYGTWLYAAPAGLVFAGLAPDLFSGLSHLDVAAVGHLTALTTGIVLGGLLLATRRRRLLPVPATDPAATPAYPAAAAPECRAGSGAEPAQIN
jgi:hypothetical protein